MANIAMIAPANSETFGSRPGPFKNSRQAFSSGSNLTLYSGGPAVGAWGGLIMSFFGAVFAALTMYWQWHASLVASALPFAVFISIGLAAARVIRMPGNGIKPSEKAERVIMWSSIAEGIGIGVASLVVVNLDRLEWRLPAMSFIVGLHFFPIAFAAPFRPFYMLGVALTLSAILGFLVRAPTGGVIAGLSAATALWIAASVAVQRDWWAKRGAKSDV